MAMCKLCRLHQHLSMGQVVFWVEWDDAGLPRLVMDSPNRVDGTHILPIIFCPFCGEELLIKGPRNAREAEKAAREAAAAAKDAKDGAGKQNG